MDIQVQLVDKAFFFTDGFNLTRVDGLKTVNLSKVSSEVIRTIGSSVACGILRSTTKYQDIIEEIRDGQMKLDAKRNLGMPVASDSVEPVLELAKIEDEIDAEVLEVMEAVIEDPEEEISVKQETSMEMDDTLLSDILNGTNKSVSRKINKASFTKNEQSRILELEIEGKNRAAIKSLIESL